MYENIIRILDFCVVTLGHNFLAIVCSYVQFILRKWFSDDVWEENCRHRGKLWKRFGVGGYIDEILRISITMYKEIFRWKCVSILKDIKFHS